MCTSSCPRRCFILHRCHHLHYPAYPLPHRHSSQTRLFLSSTYIWSAPWIPPSQCRRVSRDEEGANLKSQSSATQHSMSQLTFSVPNSQELTRIRACSGVSTSPSLQTSWSFSSVTTPFITDDTKGDYHVSYPTHMKKWHPFCTQICWKDKADSTSKFCLYFSPVRTNGLGAEYFLLLKE